MSCKPTIFSVLTFLLLASNLAAQQINSRPAYLPGQQYQLQLTQSVEDVRDKPSKKNYSTSVTLRVIRKSTEGTDLDWVASNSSSANAAERADPILQMAERIFENLHLVIHLDQMDRYAGIRNEEELKAKIQEFILLLVPQATAKIADPAERRRVADAMAKAMTPLAMLSAARKEIDLYFGLSGLPLEAGKPTRIKSSLMNPFGEPEIFAGEMTITPGEVDTSKRVVRIDFHQEFDPKLAGGSAADKTFVYGPKSAAAKAGLTLEDSGEYFLDIASGRVTQVRHVRTTRQGDEVVRVETTEITVR